MSPRFKGADGDADDDNHDNDEERRNAYCSRCNTKENHGEGTEVKTRHICMCLYVKRRGKKGKERV